MDVIKVTDVTKSFKVFKERSSTLKDRIIFRRKNKYEAFLALDNVSLTIKKGETVGLIGRNGSGKSTLLKLLTGILYPDNGSINMTGKVSSLLELGAGFHPDFTGRENIFMNAAILGLSKKQIKSKLNEIITFSELQEYIENPVRSYSSGMYMRLAFSVAIMVEPDILLIDEVLAVGDAAFQQKCMEQLMKLKSKGTTIVFVSHDLGAMEKLCDRVVWINKSKIVDEGKPRRMIDKYLTYLGEEENKRLIREDEDISNNLEELKVDEIKEIELTQDITNETTSLTEHETVDRWGNRNIEIIEVMFTDENNNKKIGFMSGDFMRIVIRYKVNHSVNSPVFGLGIHTIDHINCYGTNTYIDQYPIGNLNANDNGEISFTITSLDLVANTYLVTAAVHDINGNQYDYHDKRFSFKVSSTVSDVGIAKLNHHWINENSREES
ncbi:ABC transporter ATP-binding protein [Paenibacillus sp. PL91]|uniref:ABC transporter ATP-binding protein n=1 Tax=Paenibacillus sp. PL91 TaxID=2729538 RepID=UPI00145E9DAA|nr:ABC transporter ATP-binding protein [Paenibacillus sp. PL91]MBC9200438.1 ABC transporter ATP-binding protein [Paenibacillus sp. PL91]